VYPTSHKGPFGGDTKNPILFVSNTFDPATPLINSQTWSPLYKGSEVLTIDGVGVSNPFFHTSGPNIITAKCAIHVNIANEST
jgi:hypothetical protein